MSVQTRKLIGRSLLLLVALTMIGAMLAACAPAAPAPAAQPTAAPAAEATAAPAPAAEKVQLRFVVMDYDEKMRADTQALVDEFNASQNEIEVKLDVYSWGDGHQTPDYPNQRRPGARPGERQRAVGGHVEQGSTRSCLWMTCCPRSSWRTSCRRASRPSRLMAS